MTGLGFHFVDEGEKDKLPVVFLHAFPLNSTMWERQQQAIRGRARFIALDVRGLGKSPLGSFRFMLEHVVDDLFALLDHLGVRRAVLCGLSMGGYVALRAVEREASRVCALLLCDTQAGADGDEAKLKRADAVRKVSREGVASYAEAFLPGVLSRDTLETKPDVVANARRMILEACPEGISAALLALATRTDTTAFLSRIRVPTRVLVGEEDKTTPPEVARALRDRIPGADLFVLPGAAHMSNLESPEEFNLRMLEFVDRVALDYERR